MGSVEDFISDEKRKLQLEKQSLMLRIEMFFKNHQHVPVTSPLVSHSESATVHPNNAHINELTMLDDDEFVLPLGGYEKKRKQLAEERRKEYNRYLEELASLQKFTKLLENSQVPSQQRQHEKFLHDDRYAGSIFGMTDSKQKPVSKIAYQKDLEQQIKEKQERKAKELRDENEKLQAHNHLIWFNDVCSEGKGSLLTDADIPRKRNYMTANVSNLNVHHPFGVPNNNMPMSNIIKLNSTIIRSPSSFSNQDRYREDLLQQIEEKKQRIQEEKERQRKEEEKLAQRLEQQRLKIQKEYEEEQEKQRRKEEELKRKQERLHQIQEQQQKEIERKNKELMALKEEKKLRPAKYDEKKQNNVSSPIQQRNKSPPIPSLRTRTVENLNLPPSESPEDSREDVLSNLSQLRQQLLREQKKLNERLKIRDGTASNIRVGPEF